jgi:hypothetical protein
MHFELSIYDILVYWNLNWNLHVNKSKLDLILTLDGKVLPWEVGESLMKMLEFEDIVKQVFLNMVCQISYFNKLLVLWCHINSEVGQN